MLAAALELELHELVPEALCDLFNDLADAVPFECFAHTNKKVGCDAHSELRTVLSIGAVAGQINRRIGG
jgi:hypothetical protein